ncbi:MAG: diaminopimelate decarboxylase [Pseudomonadota bacterium]
MHHFHYRGGVLHAENVDLREIAARVGTPVYVYSHATIERHLKVFRDAFASRSVGLFYAVKANGNLAVLKIVAQSGTGADVVSQGEIRKAMAADIAPEKIIYSGVGKTDEDLNFAIDAGLYQVNVETEGELMRLATLAEQKKKQVAVALRVNPAIGAGGHAKITTGTEDNKFGISTADAMRLYKDAQHYPFLKTVGLAVHIGSQIHDLAPLRETFVFLRKMAEDLRAQGLPLERLDLGGGLGVFYDREEEAKAGENRVQAYAAMVLDVMHGFDAHLSFEPGRLIMANAGLLLTKVITHNPRAQKKFLIVDAAMNDLARPALYEARHEIWPVKEGAASVAYSVAGPVCESGDTFGDNFMLPEQDRGDLVCLMSAGAYGSVMSSTYNQRQLAAEVLVSGDQWAVVRPRQSYDDLIRADSLPPWLKA